MLGKFLNLPRSVRVILVLIPVAVVVLVFFVGGKKVDTQAKKIDNSSTSQPTPTDTSAGDPVLSLAEAAPLPVAGADLVTTADKTVTVIDILTTPGLSPDAKNEQLASYVVKSLLPPGSVAAPIDPQQPSVDGATSVDKYLFLNSNSIVIDASKGLETFTITFQNVPAKKGWFVSAVTTESCLQNNICGFTGKIQEGPNTPNDLP